MLDPHSLNKSAPQTLELLLSRRSGSAKTMTGPGPSREELKTILTAGARTPDHGKLFPWRFIVFEGDARKRMGELFADCVRSEEREPSPERLAQELNRFLRAPVIVGVISRVRESIPIPEWEQVLSAGAVCQNMLLASHAMGYAANWITEWCAYHPRVKDALGLKSGERVAGFIYIGKPAVPLEDRPRPDLDKIVSYF